MAHVDTGRSLPELLGSLATDISNLFRKEVELAKAEASEKVDLAMGASKRLAFGGVLGIAAAGVLAAAIVAGLAWFFIGMEMDPTLAFALSALIVAIVFGLIAWALISGAISAMRAEKLNFDRTTRALTRDAQVVTEKF